MFPAQVKGNFPVPVKFPECDKLPMEKPDETTLQTRVRERMEALGKKPAPLAKSIGLGDSFVRDILRKGVMPGAERLARLALALETTPEYLLGETGDAAPDLRAQQREVIELMDQLSPEVQAHYLAILRGLAAAARQGTPPEPRE